MARRGATDLSGILGVDKPVGMTSHDVLAAIRKATGEKRIGHAGTLDPMATGLLVVLIGPATRLAPYLSGAGKRYRATIAFGSSTTTDDAEGDVLDTVPVPASALERATAEEVLRSFLGVSEQVPPRFSAIKVGGRTAHRVARSGGEIELAPRTIEVSSATLLDMDAARATWTVEFEVSKGTYIRALARDIGSAVGSAAHLSALRRTASGPLDVDRDARPLESVLEAGTAGELRGLFIDPLHAMQLPVVETDAEEARDGKRIPTDSAARLEPDSLVAVSASGRLLGVYRATEDALVAQTVIPGGVAGERS